jgi:hypothetical protein
MQLAGRCQERVTMTAEPPRSPVTEAVRSLEVRWIFPGRLETAVTGWFARFPARTESREDTYLLDPQLRGLSVKVRGGGALEVKAYCGSPGILEVAGRACGSMEYWQKWSFPFSPLGPGSGDPAGWRPVRKRRRITRFSLASGQLDASGQGLGEQPRCEVELTEVQTGGQDWWTLGFEATGPADLLHSELQASAALVFVQALPGDVKPGLQASRSYAEWLGQRPGSYSDASTLSPAHGQAQDYFAYRRLDLRHAAGPSASAGGRQLRPPTPRAPRTPLTGPRRTAGRIVRIKDGWRPSSPVVSPGTRRQRETRGVHSPRMTTMGFASLRLQAYRRHRRPSVAWLLAKSLTARRSRDGQAVSRCDQH